jgi:DNA (cytosine-5)-methyltransferase 1
MTDHETWVDGDHANTLNRFDVGDTRTTHIIVNALDRQQGGADDNSAQAGHLVAETVSTLQAQHGRGFAVNAEMAAGGQLIPETFSVYPEGGNGADIAAAKVERSPALTKVMSERGVHVAEQMSVRRLTPVECERLMGLPDGWTAPEGVKAPDSKRYAACGDAIVTTVAFWIADRIRMIEEEEAS